MNNKENILKLLKALNDNLGQKRISPEVYNAQALGLEEAQYHRLLEMVIESGLVSGFSPVKVLGQSYTQYKAIKPNLTLRGIEYLESNSR
ncbi:YjcQ family protein [Lysinibacillus fusiformis]|uniref:YjcQ family protein n=1 Tax=Lysinibacillus fusiformis TaxID=28031 RepID=UPI001F4E64D8|nr:YjcQ family protein [Lysinibacillus fusiformis]MCK1989459.1 YjcQ family protein [Lysinibacillus fusiformis]